MLLHVIAFTEEAHPLVVACLYLCIKAIQRGEASCGFVLGENGLLVWNLNHAKVWFYG